jgi:hypothetical protein
LGKIVQIGEYTKPIDLIDFPTQSKINIQNTRYGLLAKIIQLKPLP